MPSTQSKRDLILKTSVAETAETAALTRLTRGDDVSTFSDGVPTTVGWRVDGRGGADDLTGNDGADIIAVSSVAIVLAPDDGGTGRHATLKLREAGEGQFLGGETATGAAGDDLVIGAGGDDSLKGDHCIVSGNDILCSTGQDYLLGFGGDDAMEGGNGDDTMDGGTGSNRIDGGDGEDTATWAWIRPLDLPRGAPGVVLNLSGEELVVGNTAPNDRVTIADVAGGVVGQGLRMPNNKNPELMRIADGEAGKLEQDSATGALFDTYDTLTGIERFDGSARPGDIAVLDEGFAAGATDAEGWTAYSDGTTTLWLRGFEFVFYA